MKLCSKCKINEVTKTPTKHKYGHYYCDQCYSKASVESAKKHKETKYKNNSKYSKSDKGKIAHSKASKKYSEANKDKRRASNKVLTALRNGSLTKEHCSVCGYPKASVHHEDYTNPLEVIWLCHLHHMERHSTMLKERSKEQ